MAKAKKVVSNAPGNGRSIASMVMGILSILFCWIPVIPLVLGVIAIVFSSRNLKEGSPGRGMAIAGLVTGILGSIFSLIYLIIWIIIVQAIMVFSNGPIM